MLKLAFAIHVLARSSALLLFFVMSAPTQAEDIFRFAPPSGTQFVRTLTRTARFEIGGMMRVEETRFRARFTFRETQSGVRIAMTPLSFQYLVNDQEIESPVWRMLRGHTLILRLNSVGKLMAVQGFEEIDRELSKGRTPSSPVDFSMHLDRFPMGEAERDDWDHRVLLWLDQPARPGTHVEFDSRESGFTGEPVNSHTTMQIVRARKCGSSSCVVTHYTMVPNLDALRLRASTFSNNDFIGASASEELEQTIEPGTMLLHRQRLIWKSNLQAATPDGTLVQNASLVAVSEYEFVPVPSQ